MNIQWNTVTWYSKLLAAILFIAALPVWTFYLGMRYEEVKIISQSRDSEMTTFVPIEKKQLVIETATSTNQEGISLNFIYPQNTNFTIKDFPEADFKINSVVKATGSIQDESGCNSPASNAFLKNLYTGNSGLCISLSTIDNQPLSLVAVDIDVSNNGAKTISGNLIQLIYMTKVNGKDVTRLAQTYLPFSSYFVNPLSSKTIRVGFMVPANQNEFSLTYGYVGVKPSSGENFFGASQGGYIVNFLTKTLVPIQG